MCWFMFQMPAAASAGLRSPLQNTSHWEKDWKMKYREMLPKVLGELNAKLILVQENFVVFWEGRVIHILHGLCKDPSEGRKPLSLAGVEQICPLRILWPFHCREGGKGKRRKPSLPHPLRYFPGTGFSTANAGRQRRPPEPHGSREFAW